MGAGARGQGLGPTGGCGCGDSGGEAGETAVISLVVLMGVGSWGQALLKSGSFAHSVSQGPGPAEGCWPQGQEGLGTSSREDGGEGLTPMTGDQKRAQGGWGSPGPSTVGFEPPAPGSWLCGGCCADSGLEDTDPGGTQAQT